MTALFAAMTLRFTRRRDVDGTRLIHRLRPASLFRTALVLLPWAVVPLVAGIWLALLVGWGHEGGAAKKQAKDYWRKNLATYRDAKVPDIQHVGLELDLFPDQYRYHARGKYMLVNLSEKPLDEILLTGGLHWEKLSWTMDGKPVSPIDRAHLYAFTPPGGAFARAEGGNRVRTRGDLSPGHQQTRGRRAGVHPAFIGRLDELSSEHRAAGRVSRFGRNRRREPPGSQGVSRRLLRRADGFLRRVPERLTQRRSRLRGRPISRSTRWVQRRRRP